MTNLDAVNSRRNTLYKKIRQFKTKCYVCSYSKEVTALEFHHIDPITKLFSIANMAMRGKAWDVICIELEKCIVLCSNCHREYHADKLNIQHLSCIKVPDIIKFEERKQCPVCKTYFKSVNKFCSENCNTKNRLNIGKVDWSTIDLLELHKTMTNVAIGKLLGVSDSYISRRIKDLKL